MSNISMLTNIEWWIVLFSEIIVWTFNWVKNLKI